MSIIYKAPFAYIHLSRRNDKYSTLASWRQLIDRRSEMMANVLKGKPVYGEEEVVCGKGKM